MFCVNLSLNFDMSEGLMKDVRSFEADLKALIDAVDTVRKSPVFDLRKRNHRTFLTTDSTHIATRLKKIEENFQW